MTAGVPRYDRRRGLRTLEAVRLIPRVVAKYFNLAVMRMSLSERSMVGALSFAALDSTYLAWRYLALRLALVRPGSSICSWSLHVDCDRVLLTPQANAFLVPNAILGSAFYIGCLVWWCVGRQFGEGYRFQIIRTLAFWLAVASVVTLRFLWLLVHLSFFCPLCPLNHVATYVALVAALITLRKISRPSSRLKLRRLIPLVVSCVLLFLIFQLIWLVAQVNGMLQVPNFSRPVPRNSPAAGTAG
jgi:uncharacterized membrane protein